MSQPLTDAINALTTYANSITGASDTTLSDAVESLVDGYGGGGGYTMDDIVQRNYTGNIVLGSATLIKAFSFAGSSITGISGEDVTKGDTNIFDSCTSLVSVDLPNIVQNGSSQAVNWFNGCTSLQSIILPSLTQMWNYFYRGCTALETVVMPSLSNSRANNFDSCSALKTVDLGVNFSSIASKFWNQSPLLNKLILRRTSGVVSLGNIDAFTGAFASGGSGGTLYVPNDLISSYQSASNWGTILGYANNSIQKIEGSIYETAYADGTPIT